jgi:hypothetical protein
MAGDRDLPRPDAYLYIRSPILAAEEGNTGPLCERLRAIATKLSETDAAVVRHAADLIEGKKKLIPNRPLSALTDLRDAEIAAYIEERLAGGRTVGDATTDAAKAFGCSESIAGNARAKARRRTSK